LDDFFAAGGTVEELMTFVIDELPVPRQPGYPIEAFPPQAQRYIREVSASLNNAPMGMVGTPLLGFAAGAISNTRFLKIKRGYSRRPILWVAVVAPTGSAKTPGQEAARRALQRVQDAAKATWDTEMEQFERDLAHWHSLAKKDQADIARPIAPAFPHFITTEATKEALASMAATSPGFTVYRDELVAWVESFDAYRAGRGGDRQDMLSLWSGGGLKIDRKGAPPIVVPHPTISVVGGVQPELLPRLSRDAGSDGFLARFLWEEQRVGVLRWSHAEVSEEAEQGIDNLFMKLRARPDSAHPNGFPVRLSEGALARYALWHDENANAQEDAPPLMAAIYAKAPLQLATVALVLHCLWHPDPDDDELSLATMNRAITLVEYHLPAAQRVMRRFQEAADHPPPKRGVAERILRINAKAQNRKGGDSDHWVSREHIRRALGNVSAEGLTAALEELVASGQMEHRKRETGHRPVDEYRLVVSRFCGNGSVSAAEAPEGEEGDL
jgi:hypothetical protein